MIMFGDQVLIKATDAREALLSLMAIYYSCSLSYPPSINGALLFLQSEVLNDSLHKSDKGVLDKCSAKFRAFTNERLNFEDI